MNKLLPADKKAIILSAWLFFSERGFSTDLIHIGDAADVELRIIISNLNRRYELK